MFKKIILSLVVCFAGSPVWALRIVSLLPSNTEILEAVGAGEDVVGVTRFDTLLTRGKNVGDVGDFMHPNMEKIVSLKPDLVVAGYWTSSHIVPRLEKLGYTVLQVKNPESLEAMYQSIRVLAKAAGRPDNAEPVIQALRTQFQKVRERAQKLPRRYRMYLEIDTPYWTIGGNDYLNEALALAGADNIFTDLSRPSAQVSPELIVERDPDLIVVFSATKEDIIDRPGWKKVKAVKSRAIIDDFPQDALSRPSPPLAAGIEAFVARLERLSSSPAVSSRGSRMDLRRMSSSPQVPSKRNSERDSPLKAAGNDK